MRCFVLGNGPSLALDNLDLLQNEVTFGVNQCELIYSKTTWRPTYWVCADRDLAIPLAQWAEIFFQHYLLGEHCFISPRHMTRLRSLPFLEETWENWKKKRNWPAEWAKTVTPLPKFEVLNFGECPHGTKVGHLEW